MKHTKSIKSGKKLHIITHYYILNTDQCWIFIVEVEPGETMLHCVVCHLIYIQFNSLN